MHARQQLVDHLERGALARGIAEFIELCRHRIERGPRPGESGGTAGGENGQFALRRALCAAGDRCVEVMPARRLQLAGEPPRDIRVHGRRRDEHRILGQGFGNPIPAEQNGFGLGGIDDHADDDIGLPCGFRRRLGARSPVSDKTRNRIRRYIAAGDGKTRAPQRGRHAKAHRAEPNDGDTWFFNFRHAAVPRTFLKPPSGCGFGFGYHGLAALPKRETRRQGAAGILL